MDQEQEPMPREVVLSHQLLLYQEAFADREIPAGVQERMDDLRTLISIELLTNYFNGEMPESTRTAVKTLTETLQREDSTVPESQIPVIQ